MSSFLPEKEGNNMQKCMFMVKFYEWYLSISTSFRGANILKLVEIPESRLGMLKYNSDNCEINYIKLI